MVGAKPTQHVQSQTIKKERVHVSCPQACSCAYLCDAHARHTAATPVALTFALAVTPVFLNLVHCGNSLPLFTGRFLPRDSRRRLLQLVDLQVLAIARSVQ